MIFEFEGKTEKEAIELAVQELGLEREEFDVEIMETQKNSLFKKGFVKIRVHTDGKKIVSDISSEPTKKTQKKVFGNPLPQDDFEKEIITFITTVVTKMGYDISVDVMHREEKKIELRLESSSSAVIIGKKGRNLDALQLLTNVYAGKLGRSDERIILDIENYRIRREESLVRLAYTTADRVRTSRNSFLLDPMNPFERRIVHTTLNDIGDIETKSEGEGLFKQVRVKYKGFF
jgi:spoIIIJ-associated protein